MLPARSSATLLGLITAVILAASVMTAHAAARMDHRAPLFLLSLLHEAATGFWIGGLPFLVLGTYVAKDAPARWYLTDRFSRVALVSVAVLVLSGLGLSVGYIGSLRAFYGTAYGVMVAAKASMLGALLVLGAINFLMLRKYSPEEVLPRLRQLGRSGNWHRNHHHPHRRLSHLAAAGGGHGGPDGRFSPHRGAHDTPLAPPPEP